MTAVERKRYAKTMHEQDLEVGRYEASFWGAEVISCEDLTSGTNFKMRYHCIEHGEYFYFDLDWPQYKRALAEM